MRHSCTLLALPLSLALAACGGAGNETATDDAATPPAVQAPADGPAATAGTVQGADPAMGAATATATLAATEGNAVGGNLRFNAAADGVRITGQVTGLPAGSEHGFHVHETGDCSAPDASSAGGHFNPASSPHGRVGQPPHHAGDTDNLTADADGVAEVERQLQGATLGDGAGTDIVGKAVIVHANPDDYSSQPSGDAGDRLACGVIESAS
jgi:superoxide dismutase, Cu-Zn family